jgi:hypothetical protein
MSEDSLNRTIDMAEARERQRILTIIDKKIGELCYKEYKSAVSDKMIRVYFENINGRDIEKVLTELKGLLDTDIMTEANCHWCGIKSISEISKGTAHEEDCECSRCLDDAYFRNTPSEEGKSWGR